MGWKWENWGKLGKLSRKIVGKFGQYSEAVMDVNGDGGKLR